MHPLPAIESPHELSTTTPVRDVFVDEAEASLKWGKDDHLSLLEEDFSEIEEIKQKQSGRSVPSVSPATTEIFPKNNNFKKPLPPPLPPLPLQSSGPIAVAPRPALRPAPKNIMHDVVVEDQRRMTTGPEEEIQNFSIVDFRRLARDPNKAGDMLSAKFEGWREESFLLFMKTRKSWQNSPLHKTYIDFTTKALNLNTNIASLLQQDQAGQNLNMGEYLALVGVNRRLEV